MNTYAPTFEDLHLPYFVYGTLRPDWGNSRVWRYRDGVPSHDGEAYVCGYQMVDHGIPYAVASARWSDRVVGCLITPPDDYSQRWSLRQALDGLEGHPHHYERVRCQANVPGGTVRAWIYTPTEWRPEGPIEPTGDYTNCGRRLRTTT